MRGHGTYVIAFLRVKLHIQWTKVRKLKATKSYKYIKFMHKIILISRGSIYVKYFSSTKLYI